MIFAQWLLGKIRNEKKEGHFGYGSETDNSTTISHNTMREPFLFIQVCLLLLL